MTRKGRQQRGSIVSFRVTEDQRALLDRQAAGMALGSYIKSCLFAPYGSPAYPRRTRGQFPTKDRTALAGLLAMLGKSDAAANLSEIARLARNGSLPVTADTEAALQTACCDIAAIRALLIRALGLEP